MPQNKDFKRIVRRRMADTGEPYTAARAALAPDPLSKGARLWLGELGKPDRALAAYAALKTLPEAELRIAALAGIDHQQWQVRRRCCRLLDDLTLTSSSIAALTMRLQDAHPRVRQAALHTLTCVHCKPDGCALDVRPLFERMASDPSRYVRGGVVGPLTWAYDEPWALELLRHFAKNDPSTKLRRVAEHGIANLEWMLQSDELRRQLPTDLRMKTERHRGKWVAIAGGRIIGVDRSAHRQFRSQKNPGTALYWVRRGLTARTSLAPLDT